MIEIRISILNVKGIYIRKYIEEVQRGLNFKINSVSLEIYLESHI